MLKVLIREFEFEYGETC